MGRQFVTACMFCLLCSAHTHCSSHHYEPQIGHIGRVNYYTDEGGGQPFPFEDLELVASKSLALKRPVREAPLEDVDYVKIIFEKYGNGETLTKEGFVEMLKSLGLPMDTASSGVSENGRKVNDSSKTSGKCDLSLSKIPSSGLERKDYKELCPQILHQLIPELRFNCTKNDSASHTHSDDDEHAHPDVEPTSQLAIWFYATISVVLISLCGLLAVAIIPIMQKQIYHGLLQFFVALAVGTLVGDALLHLLPHAMMSAHADHAHDHSPHAHSSSDEDQHTTNLLKGLVAALSAIFFYFTEKGLSLVTDWKQRHQRKNQAMTKVRVMREDRSSHEEARVGEKLCKHKYSSYPYCYGEITNNSNEAGLGASDSKPTACYKDVNNTKPQETDAEPKEDVPSSEKQLLESSETQNEYTTVILREHETVHHGHSHTHGHVHSAPGSIKSVAWMVIMGDGIHNLTDGLAIGAAFAANVGGGLSTAVAVFCHELPHEIGDFAVLLKAGMSMKEAVVYNLISSILCLIGMSLGVILGQNDHVKLWVFAAAAGMFLYIALVDMIPELTSSHASEGSSACCQCLLQLLGLLSGVGIMLLIALYEHDLMTVFSNSL